MSEAPWWRSGVIYQIYPRSFQDTNGDGVGDLEGIRTRLDYLAELGVAAIWLSPIFCSPNADFGYDTSNYRDIDPSFGTLAGFRRLVDDAHRRGIRVILDLVFNHTSVEHPWFAESRASRRSPRRDWYIWRPPHAGGPPNNWASAFGGGAWEKDETTGEYYLHSFMPQQPDLNWRNPEVRAELLAIMRHWLDFGVDGFRLDVFNCYLKDPQLRDNPRRFHPLGWAFRYLGQDHVHDRDHPDLHDVLAEMRQLCDAYPERALVGETLDERFVYDLAASYCGPQGLHMAFNFQFLHAPWKAHRLSAAIRAWLEDVPPGGWPTWVAENHDFVRASARHAARGLGDARMKLVALMLMTLRGTPFVYYGQELGMRQAKIPREQIADPIGKAYWPLHKGRDGARTPMQWTAEPGAGFTAGEPWLPIAADATERNVDSQRADPASLWNAYRELIALRRRYPALSSGDIEVRPDQGPVLSWVRRLADESIEVALNVSSRPAPWQGAIQGGQLLWSTHPDPRLGQDELGAHQGVVVLRSARG